MSEKLLTTGEAAKYLHISTATLRRWREKGLIDTSHQTAGGHARFSETSLADLKQALKDGVLKDGTLDRGDEFDQDGEPEDDGGLNESREPENAPPSSAKEWAADMLEQVKKIELAPDKTDFAQQMDCERYLDALLPACEDWMLARKIGLKLVDDAFASGEVALGIVFFKHMAQNVLPVLLHAAAVMEEDSRRIEKWLLSLDRGGNSDAVVTAEVDSILRWKTIMPR
jgi:excisionase family DNA binding protein